MKKTLLFTLAVASAAALSAQTVIFEDDFESYLTGSYLAQSSEVWTTWNGSEGGNLDCIVSEDVALSGAKSAMLQQTDATNGGPTDMFLPIGIASGQAEVEFNMFVLNGMAGYFNFQESTNPGDGWGFEYFMNGDGTTEIIQDAVTVGTGTYSTGAWLNFKINVDVDGGSAELYQDDALQATIVWDTPLGGINFFAWGGAGATGFYFIDDVSVTYTGVDIAENVAPSFNLYPNPADQTLNINLSSNTQANVRVLDLTGKVVFSGQIVGNGLQTVSTAEFAEGLYFVELVSAGERVTSRVVVKH
jgi:hypothetical protein